MKKTLPQILSAFTISTLLLSAYAQYIYPNTTNTNTTDLNEKCTANQSCIALFDIVAVCGIPKQDEDPNTVYPDYNIVTEDQWRCYCKTLGFLRHAVECAQCYEISIDGWMDWCTDAPKKKLSAGAIAGIVIGSLLLVGGIVYAIYWKLNNKKKARAMEPEEVFALGTKTEVDGASAGMGLPVYRPAPVEIDGYERRVELPSPSP